MRQLLCRRVMLEATAIRLAWLASFTLLSACTALVLMAAPGLGVARDIGLLAAILLAWAVVGWQLPRFVRGS